MSGSIPDGFKIIKLPRNGPKAGQSMKAWLYGKEQEAKEFQRKLDGQGQNKQK